MSLAIIDIGFLAIIAIFTISGAYYGFIRTLGGIAGFVIALVATSFTANYLVEQWGFAQHGWIAIIGFISILLLFMRLADWLVDMLVAVFNVVSILPFLKTINRILGLILGVLLGSSLVISIVYFVQQYLPETHYEQAVLSSHLYPVIDVLQGMVTIFFL